jgi:hypothetical protein
VLIAEKGFKPLADLAGVELSSESTRDSKAGVGVGKELGGVLLDLGDLEANAGVLTVHNDTSEEGSLEAADSVAALLVADGVREGNADLELACVSSHASPTIETYRGGPDLPLGASWM